MTQVPLATIAFARAGDKADTSDIGLFARAGPHGGEVYEVLRDRVTAAAVKEHFGALVTGDVERYEVPNVLALKFVLHGALGGGGPRSLRADNLGKALGGALLRLRVDVDAGLLERLGPRPAPPTDPYAGVRWTT